MCQTAPHRGVWHHRSLPRLEKRKFAHRIRTWKLRNPATVRQFQSSFQVGNWAGATTEVTKLLEQVLDFFIREMVDIDEMQFGFMPGRDTTDTIFTSCRRSTSQLRGYSTLPSLTLIQPSIVCQGRSFGGSQGASGLRNGLCVSSRAHTPMPGVVCESIVSAVRNLTWDLVCVKALS